MTGFWLKAEQIYAARLEAMAGAKNSIQLETYYMTPGTRADDCAEILSRQARAGVKVRVIADGFGTKSMPKTYWQRLEAAGVEIRIFNPLNWKNSFKALKRNHRKLLIIDGKWASIGGAGISDHWDGLKKIGDRAPWLDYEVAFEGPVVERLCGIFIQHFLSAGGSVDLDRYPLTRSESKDPTILITSSEDPTLRDSATRSLYQVLIQAAKERVWISSPYFLPSPTSYQLLLAAKHRGVDLRVLTMGKHCDKQFVRLASRSRYKNLIEAGIEIYEYQPSMMHAKAVLIDDSWTSVGSTNFDPRSYYRNDELNLSTPQDKLVRTIESFFLDAFTQSQLITLKDWHRRSLLERLMGRFWLLFYWQL